MGPAASPRRLPLWTLLLLLPVERSSSFHNNDEWIRVPIPKNVIPPPDDDNGTAWWNLTEWNSTPIGRTAFLWRTGLWNSPVFRVLYDPETMHRVSESSSSSVVVCEWAVNGGPFQTDGTPVGVVIANGTIAAGDRHDPTKNVGFGITRDGNFYILGNINARRRRDDDDGIASDDDNDDNIIDDLQEFVTGFDWLVYNGTAHVGNDTTGAARAPRTAIGVDGHGRLLWLVVDGCEVCFRRRGPTLPELADLMITHASAVWAINLDGGGSSALAHRGRLVNRPWPWERPVATILCATTDSTHHHRDVFPRGEEDKEVELS